MVQLLRELVPELLYVCVNAIGMRIRLERVHGVLVAERCKAPEVPVLLGELESVVPEPVSP